MFYLDGINHFIIVEQKNVLSGCVLKFLDLAQSKKIVNAIDRHSACWLGQIPLCNIEPQHALMQNDNKLSQQEKVIDSILF
jgi:hypothetical protein